VEAKSLSAEDNMRFLMGLFLRLGQLLLYHAYAHHEPVTENHLEKL